MRLALLIVLVGCTGKSVPPLDDTGIPDDSGLVGLIDADRDGWGNDTDCDDTDADVHPDAAEVCDGLDNNCDGQIDDGAADGTEWYLDQDLDGFGDEATAQLRCDAPQLGVTLGGDCDDADPAVNPAADEICDAVDNDCDDLVDEDALDALDWYWDADGDGHGDPRLEYLACDQPADTVGPGDDCDDADAAVFPDAEELCNGIDDDCDAVVDGTNAVDAADWYADADHDGYGAGLATTSCRALANYSESDGDCDDGDPEVSPAAAERCNMSDDDCDGAEDDGLPDLDGSGLADCREVAVVVGAAFHAAGLTRVCDGLPVDEAETTVLSAALSDMGLGAVLVEDDPVDGVDAATLALYPVVIYTVGGWPDASTLGTVHALSAAAASGQGLLLMGDDLGRHARKVKADLGTTALYDLLYIGGVLGDGAAGAGAMAATWSHPVMNGPWGRVASFSYDGDIDVVSGLGSGEAVLMTLGGVGSPTLIANEDSGQRTVVSFQDLYASRTCPVSSTAGLAQLDRLFRNAVWWLWDN